MNRSRPSVCLLQPSRYARHQELIWCTGLYAMLSQRVPSPYYCDCEMDIRGMHEVDRLKEKKNRTTNFIGICKILTNVWKLFCVRFDFWSRKVSFYEMRKKVSEKYCSLWVVKQAVDRRTIVQNKAYPTIRYECIRFIRKNDMTINRPPKFKLPTAVRAKSERLKKKMYRLLSSSPLRKMPFPRFFSF